MEHVADAYKDGSYAAKNPRFGDDHAKWKAANAFAMIQKSGLKPRSVCEIGCGGGGIMLELKNLLGPETSFTGYEPMPEAFAQANSRTSERLTFVNGTLEEIPADRHDLALMFDVFEHVEDYIGFLRRAALVARDFLFHIPLDMNAQMVLRETPIKKVRENVGHLHYYSKYSALATLEYAGFEIVNHFYTDGFHAGTTSAIQRLTHLPRVALYKLNPDFAVRLMGGYPLMVHARSKALS
jgi:ubiquinone/menaquinone biosynthesis C-methylase UbiE